MKKLKLLTFINKQNILFSLLLILLFIIYLSGLFVDVTRDAAKYAYIPKEFIKSNQWINLQILGESYNQKPHLMFWLSGISYLLFGVSNFSFKLPIFLYSLLGLYFTYKLGERIYSKKTAKLSVVILAFSIIFMLYNQDLHTDTILFTGSAFALWQLFEFLTNRKWLNLFLSGIALGICLLSKGPFGVIIPFLAVMGFLLSQRKWKQMFDFRWFLIVVIAFTIALPVFYQLYLNWGIKGISFFFVGNTMGRFTGSYLGHTPDPFFYLHNIAYLLLPWSIVFFYAIIRYISNSIHKKLAPSEHYLLWGLLTFIVLLSISTSKLPNYLMGALPLIAIITSNAWLKLLPHSRFVIKLQTIINYSFWGIAIAIIFFFCDGNQRIVYISLAIVLFIASHLFTKSFLQFDRLYYRALTGIVVTGLTLNLVAVPVLFGYQSQPQAANFLNNQKLVNPAVFNYQKGQNKFLRRLWENPDSIQMMHFNQTPVERHFSYNYELMFYLNYPVQHIETTNEFLNALTNNNAWFYTDEEGKLAIEDQAIQIDTILTLKHFNLKRTALLFTTSKDKSPFVNQYLIKTQPNNEQ